MALSNTATPIYYGRFREAVMRGEIPDAKTQIGILKLAMLRQGKE